MTLFNVYFTEEAIKEACVNKNSGKCFALSSKVHMAVMLKGRK
jgi:hypothetical protein